MMRPLLIALMPALSLAVAASPRNSVAGEGDGGWGGVWRETGFDHIAVQSQGIPKSLATFARDSLREIASHRSIARDDQITLVMRLVADPNALADRWLIPVDGDVLIPRLQQAGVEVRNRTVRLGDCFRVDDAGHLVEGAAAQVAYQTAMSNRDGTPLHTAANRLYGRINAALEVATGFRVLPDPIDAEGRWSTVGEAPQLNASQDVLALLGAVAADDPGAARPLAARLAQELPMLPNYPSPTRLAIDHAYSTKRPYFWASVAYVLSAVLFLVALITDRTGRDRPLARPHAPTLWWLAAVVVMGTGWVIHALGMAARGYLLHRMPLSNLYEATTTGIAFIILVALGLEIVYRMRVVGLCAALLSFIYYRWLLSSEVYGNDAVTPMLAVLNSYWLDYHVTLMILSYGAFTVAFSMAVLYLLRAKFPRMMAWAPSAPELDLYNHRAIQVGWPLLGIGIVLGALWADTAWGRMWSWDPKETWALITWLIYTAYLHVRLVHGWKGTTMAWASIGGYACVLFTYLGVNFVLSGLHSYAGNDPVNVMNPLRLILRHWPIAVAALMALVAWTLWLALLRTPARSGAPRSSALES
jgi:cytochrome c-type biogenesis protein CcsB